MLCIIDMQNDFVDQQKEKMAVKGAIFAYYPLPLSSAMSSLNPISS